MTGRSPSGRACGPSDLSQSPLSQPEALVPNAGFTPAPWRKQGLRVLAPDNQTICIAELIAPGIDTSEPHANAALISAAPALHSVVAGFRRKLETYVSVYPGDKELRRLLSECDEALRQAGGWQ